MAITQHRFTTHSGKVSTFFGHPFHFLSEKEKEDFDEIGYTGRLNGVKTTWVQYLDSLGIGSFDIEQLKFDNGDFSEEYMLVRVH
jgi:hypothetical protein